MLSFFTSVTADASLRLWAQEEPIAMRKVSNWVLKFCYINETLSGTKLFGG